MPQIDRTCLRDPIPEIFDAARFLDAAVAAHLAGNRALADELIRLADHNAAIAEWMESLWGPGGPHSRPRMPVPPVVPEEQRAPLHNASTKRALVARDGYRCRFCGIPVVRPETRESIRRAYPEALRWGRMDSTGKMRWGNADKHTGFQAMELNYDHLLPWTRGGTSELSNMVIACAPCNCGRANRTLAEVGLADPLLREPVRSTWDGLEHFR